MASFPAVLAVRKRLVECRLRNLRRAGMVGHERDAVGTKPGPSTARLTNRRCARPASLHVALGRRAVTELVKWCASVVSCPTADSTRSQADRYASLRSVMPCAETCFDAARIIHSGRPPVHYCLPPGLSRSWHRQHRLTGCAGDRLGGTVGLQNVVAEDSRRCGETFPAWRRK